MSAFFARHGPPGLPDWSELPGAYRPERPQVLSLIDQAFAGYVAERGLAQRPPRLTRVEVFGVRARLLRDLVRILEAHQGLLYPG